MVNFLAAYRFSQRKVVFKFTDHAIIEGRVRALISANDYGRRRLEELNGLKAKLKQAYDKLITESERHFDSVPDGNIFQVEQCL